MSSQLPRNVTVVVDLLAERGPLPLSELVVLLAEKNVTMRPGLLEELPARYPSALHSPKEDQLAAGPRPSPRQRPEEAPEHGPVWSREPVADAMSADRVIVVDIETTGLDPESDSVSEVAAFSLTGALLFSGIVTNETSEADLIVQLTQAIAGAGALVGHGIGEFDAPFLAERAQFHGDLAWPDLPVIDTLDFSVLVWPNLPSRRLSDLCRHAGVTNVAPHTAEGDARATFDLVNTMIQSIDPNDLSWQLAAACLRAARSNLGLLLPPIEAPRDLGGYLEPLEDPLLNPTGQSSPSATAHVRSGLERLTANGQTRDRPSQRAMALSVAQCLDGGGRLAVEAPTGTGKTLAYLLAALGRAAVGPVVIATATRVLQDQIRREALALETQGLLSAPVRQIQGVGNYLCTREIAESLDSSVSEPDELLALAVATRGLAGSPNGTWSDVTDAVISRRSRTYRVMRGSLRTDAQQCERQQCEFAARCPMMQRLVGMAENPGIVVTNHALVATWISPTETEPGTARETTQEAEAGAPDQPPSGSHPAALLTGGEAALVLDEAHELEDTLTSAWSDELSEIGMTAVLRQVLGRRGLVRDLRHAEKALDPGTSWSRDLTASVAELSDAIEDLGETIRHYVEQFGRGEQVQLLRGVAPNRPEFRQLRDKATNLRNHLLVLQQELSGVGEELAGYDPPTPEISRAKRRLWGLRTRLGDWVSLLESLKEVSDDHALVHLLEIERFDSAHLGSWVYRTVPIEVGPLFVRDVVHKAPSLVLTSATLRAGGTWDYLERRLGISIDIGADEPDPWAFTGEVLSSPFNFGTQALAVLTNHLPVPTPTTEQEFVEELAADQVGFLSLSGGKALTLFAARSRMEAVAELVRTKSVELGERGVRILVQGDLSGPELTEAFRADYGATAYGLRSLWQGFDAPGETLSYLFIEKPPYPHPNDPVIASRQKRIQEQGGDPFLDYIAPKTAVLFAQGFGRLIRTETDRGVAIICDRRLQSPSAANRILLDSLPGPTIATSMDRDHAWTLAIEFVTGSKPDISQALALQIDQIGAILEELRIRPGDDIEEKLRRAAAQLFGVETLYPEQLELMCAQFDGRDSIGILPTGFGKSLCFQLPALLRGDDRPTVVVSPLIALIKDQVDDLRGRRRLRPVQGITGNTTSTVRTEIMRDVAEGKIRLLYLSPERLVRDPVLRLALGEQSLAGLVIDEAHCVSVWGHDFRPEFRQIPKAVESFERAPRMALTATATREVAEDIVDSARLDDPLEVRLPADRQNLRLYVQRCDSNRHRARELLRIVTYFSGQPGIVYTSKRSTSEELASLLRHAGINARHYHAGLVGEQREAIQDQFLDGLTDVIVATKAFGMGINKPDIGWVVHYDLPESLDSYAQEAGRAARMPSITGHCVLLFTKADLGRRRGLLAKDRSTELQRNAATILREIGRAPTRGGDHLIDADKLAANNEIEVDELNRIVAWLERLGCVDRGVDCSSAGMITLGYTVPDDESERRAFRELVVELNLRIGSRRRIVFADLDTGRFDADELENLLVRWTLARHISFNASQRVWRVRLTDQSLNGPALRLLLNDWSAWQHRRLKAMIDYATGHQCRRVSIARHFGDPAFRCSESGSVDCDACAPETPPWSAVPDVDVPDPEELIDVGIELLRCVDWATRFSKGNYGEAGLKLALLGAETFGAGHSLGPGLLSCPQFGSLKYVRGGNRRLDEEIEASVTSGLIDRVQAEYQARTYDALVITPAGRSALELGRRQGSGR